MLLHERVFSGLILLLFLPIQVIAIEGVTKFVLCHFDGTKRGADCIRTDDPDYQIHSYNWTKELLTGHRP